MEHQWLKPPLGSDPASAVLLRPGGAGGRSSGAQKPNWVQHDPTGQNAPTYGPHTPPAGASTHWSLGTGGGN